MDEGGRDVPSKYAVQDAQVNLISKELPFIWIYFFGIWSGKWNGNDTPLCQC